MKRLYRNYLLYCRMQKYAGFREDCIQACKSPYLDQRGKDAFLNLAYVFNRTVNRIHKLIK